MPYKRKRGQLPGWLFSLWPWPFLWSFSPDQFQDTLAGLILAEIEMLAAELQALPLPDFAVCDVTAVPFFTGGQLVAATAAAPAEQLALYL